MHYYTKHIKDYKTDTAHLTLLEHGVYNSLIDLYILTENPLEPNLQKLCRLVNATTDDEIKSVENILDEFFTESDDGYRQKKCDQELIRIFGKSESARKSAKHRWGSERNANAMQTDSERNANGMLPNTQDPLPNNPIPNKEDPLIKMELFNSFWKAYPHRDGKKSTKKQSFSWWNKQSLDTLTMVLSKVKLYKSHIEKCLRDGVFESAPPDPIRYLQNERFNDVYKPTNSTYSNIK